MPSLTRSIQNTHTTGCIHTCMPQKDFYLWASTLGQRPILQWIDGLISFPRPILQWIDGLIPFPRATVHADIVHVCMHAPYFKGGMAADAIQIALPVVRLCCLLPEQRKSTWQCNLLLKSYLLCCPTCCEPGCIHPILANLFRSHNMQVLQQHLSCLCVVCSACPVCPLLQFLPISETMPL